MLTSAVSTSPCRAGRRTETGQAVGRAVKDAITQNDLQATYAALRKGARRRASTGQWAEVGRGVEPWRRHFFRRSVRRRSRRRSI